ncbi:MAG: Inositol-phosphate phosphatase [Chlamydiales bacterium]|jgi:myo-inositol-1(or 4)-monophosphatase|nr:Inositol-phosphate phosphatase [Chlamydiales bacterium]
MEFDFADQLEHIQETALEAALAGGEILKKYWGKQFLIEDKDLPGNLVTEVDREAESKILSIVQKAYPSHHFIAEESGEQGASGEWSWAIDPLDGTTNYTHSFPMVAISIGVLYHQRPVAGVIFNPIMGELFLAARGLGATLNGKRISVSKALDLQHSLLATGFPYDRAVSFDNNYREFFQITSISQGVRRLGSASLDLAYVAAGRLDGYWESGLKVWDIAAGAVLVEEAGGVVTSYDRGSFLPHSGEILATNGQIHAQLSGELLAACQKKVSLG